MDTRLDPASLLREARERVGISQRALADRAGTSQSVIARIESGHSNPTVSTLNRLLEAAGCSIDVRLRLTSAAYRARAAAYFEDHAPAGVVAAYLHGSTARGLRHRESDVDIGVLVDRATHPSQTQRAELRVHLASELVAALGINEVDVLVLNDVPPGLAARIALDGTLLMMSDAETVHAFTRDIQLRRADLAPFLRRTNRLKREALKR